MSRFKGKSFRVVAIVGLIVVGAMMAAAAWAGSQLRSPAQAAADAAPPPASNVTSEVERRILSEPVVLRGKVTPGASVKLSPPPDLLGPNSVVTKVHIAKGERIRSGDPLLEIAGRPLFAMTLPFAPYRDMTGGAEGPDVTAIQRLLRGLGYSPSLNGRLDARTQRALGRFYQDRGYQAPVDKEAGDKVKAATDRVEQAESAYEAAKASELGAATPPQEGETPDAPALSVAAAMEQLAEARKGLAEAQVLAGPSLPRAEVVLLPRTGGYVTALHAKIGTVLKNEEGPVVELDGASAYVAAVADSDQVGLLRKGLKSTVLDDTTGVEAEAVISSVATRQTTDNSSGTSGYLVALTFSGSAMEPSAERSVRVTIPVAASAEPVLAVPITAVSSRPDGTTFVTAENETGGTVEITVRTGQIAGGWVEIMPDADEEIAEGDLVVVGQSASGLSKRE